MAHVQEFGLVSHVGKSSEDFLVAIYKSQDLVLDIDVVGKFLDEDLQAAKVVTRYAGKQMVHSLELESTVEEVEPSRAFNVHSGTKLVLGE